MAYANSVIKSSNLGMVIGITVAAEVNYGSTLVQHLSTSPTSTLFLSFLKSEQSNVLIHGILVRWYALKFLSVTIK